LKLFWQSAENIRGSSPKANLIALMKLYFRNGSETDKIWRAWILCTRLGK